MRKKALVLTAENPQSELHTGVLITVSESSNNCSTTIIAPIIRADLIT